MQTPPILIACIGNLFLGDDAFGVEVARRLLARPAQPGVRIVDFGIRGLDLAYCLLEDHSYVILVDALPRGEGPGTLYVIQPDIASLQAADASSHLLDAHSMHPEKALRAALSMGAKLDQVVLLGCQPTPFDSETDMQMELSPPVQAAVDEAIRMIDSMIDNFLQDQRTLVGFSAGTHFHDAAKELLP